MKDVHGTKIGGAIDRLRSWAATRFNGRSSEAADDLLAPDAILTELRTSRAKFKNLFDNAHVGMGRARISDGKVLEANDRYAEIFGYSCRQKFIDEFVFADHFVDPRDRQRLISEGLATGSVRDYEIEYRRRDGSRVWCLLSAKFFKDEGYLEPVLVDITAQKNAERAARESEARLQSLLDSAPLDISLKDLEGRYTRVNRSFLTNTEMTEEQLLGKTALDIVPSDAARTIADMEQGVVRSGQIVRREIDTFTSAGARTYLSVKFPVRDADGETVNVGTMATDISELKDTQLALEESQQRFQDFAESASDWIWEMDAELRFSRLGQRYFDVTGLEPEMILGKSPRDFGNPDDPDSTWNRLVDILESHEAFKNFEFSRLHPDGHEVALSVSAKPSFADDGRFLGYRGVGSDISAQKMVAQSLRKNERRLRHIFDQSDVCLWDEDFSQIHIEFERLRETGVKDLRSYLQEHPQAAGNLASKVAINRVNNATLRLFGAKSQEELLGSLDKILPLAGDELFINEFVAIWEGHDFFRREVEHRNFAGETLTVLLSIPIPKTKEEFSSVIVSVTDISERKLAENAQREQAERIDLVHRMMAAVYQANNAEEALQIGLREIREYLGWPIGHVFLCPEHGAGGLRSSGIWCLPDAKRFAGFRQATEACEFAIGEGLPGRVLESKQSAWIGDLRSDDNFPRAGMVDDLGVRTGLAIRCHEITREPDWDCRWR